MKPIKQNPLRLRRHALAAARQKESWYDYKRSSRLVADDVWTHCQPVKIILYVAEKACDVTDKLRAFSLLHYRAGEAPTAAHTALHLRLALRFPCRRSERLHHREWANCTDSTSYAASDRPERRVIYDQATSGASTAVLLQMAGQDAVRPADAHLLLTYGSDHCNIAFPLPADIEHWLSAVPRRTAFLTDP